MYQKEFEDYIKKEYTDNNGNLVKPYYEIDELNWARLKEKYDKDDIKETLAEILMEYEPPYMDISLEEATDDFRKLGIHSYAKQNEYIKESRQVNYSDWMTDVEEIDEKSVEIDDQLDPSYLDKPSSAERHEKTKTKIIKRRLDSLFVDTPWFARSEYKWKLSNRVLKRNNAGNKASNYFQQKNRWSVDGSVSPGPLRTWNSKDFMTSLMGSLFTLKAEKVDKSALRTSIGLRKYICSQFRPNVAKQIYNFYLDSLDAEFRDNLNEVRTVLDFSMGWGDRLCGFYASDATTYIGMDPRIENHPIYDEQKLYYEQFVGERQTKFIPSPAEDADLTDYENSVDLIFTSPPYFSVERYSYDDTQSWVRHKNIDRWNEDFLHKALNNVLTTLKSGGLLMVNISDVNATSKGTKGGKQWLKICDPMNEYLQSRGDMTYVECFGMEMAKRPNCLGIGTAEDIDDSNMDVEYHEREGSFGEPVWVWQKN